MSIHDIWKSWSKFWFEPISPKPIALFRIFWGLLILQTFLIHVGGDFLTWYGTKSVIPLESVKQSFWWNQPRFDILLLFPQDDFWLICYFITFIIAAIFVVIGFGTRYSVAYVVLGIISFHNHMPFNINGGDTFMRLVGIFLIFSSCGYAYSIDNWIAKRKGLEVPEKACPWGQRMIQIQLAIAYCDTFWCKFSGVQWLDGTAVYYATHLQDLQRIPIPFLFENLFFCKILSWFTLVIEIAIWTLVWIKECRYWVLLATFFLHFGIDMAINLPVFEWAFIATLITFVEGEDLDKALDFAKVKLELLKAKLAG